MALRFNEIKTSFVGMF